MRQLTCDMEKGCAASVTMIDESGWTYCTRHGNQRKGAGGKRCRLLSAAEKMKLIKGEPIPYRRPKPAAKVPHTGGVYWLTLERNVREILKEYAEHGGDNATDISPAAVALRLISDTVGDQTGRGYVLTAHHTGGA